MLPCNFTRRAGMMRFFGRLAVVIPTSVLLMATACSGSGSSTSSSGSAAGGEDVAVTLEQWAVTPTATTVSAGSVTFTVKNDGTIPHEFVVLQTEALAGDFPIGSFEGEPDRIDEDTAGTNVGETGDMNAGTTKTLTINLAPGHYALVCNLPAHYGQGMHTDFTVT
jgi:uncharacterized cupredoxin-like copper-binding protein